MGVLLHIHRSVELNCALWELQILYKYVVALTLMARWQNRFVFVLDLVKYEKFKCHSYASSFWNVIICCVYLFSAVFCWMCRTKMTHIVSLSITMFQTSLFKIFFLIFRFLSHVSYLLHWYSRERQRDRENRRRIMYRTERILISKIAR